MKRTPWIVTLGLGVVVFVALLGELVHESQNMALGGAEFTGESRFLIALGVVELFVLGGVTALSAWYWRRSGRWLPTAVATIWILNVIDGTIVAMAGVIP